MHTTGDRHRDERTESQAEKRKPQTRGERLRRAWIAGIREAQVAISTPFMKKLSATASRAVRGG